MSTKLRRIALFGGTFDPLHIGHMAVANDVLYRAPSVEAVWLLPTVQNPLKSQHTLLPFEMRCRLIEETISGDCRFSCCRIEEELPQPHYTFDTLELLSHRHPEVSFFLLIGADNWHSFERWYRYPELLERYEVFIYPRQGFPVDASNLPTGVSFLFDAPLVEVSSSEIRRRALLGQDLRYLLSRPELFQMVLEIARDESFLLEYLSEGVKSD